MLRDRWTDGHKAAIPGELVIKAASSQPHNLGWNQLNFFTAESAEELQTCSALSL